MTWVGTTSINLFMQAALLIITAYFFYRQWKIHQEAEVGGQTARFSKLVLIGLGLLTISEAMAFFVLQYQMPYFWVKLYEVAPQIAGILLIFVGLISLLRSFQVFED